jgi:LemA protein
MNSLSFFIIAAIVIVVAALAGYVISIYNKLAKSKIRVSEAFSTMDVFLKKRWDLIPNIVESVKGYVKHEDSLFRDIAELRSNAISAKTNKEKFEFEQQASQNISSLIAIAESFPELKANKGFNELREELVQCEEDIANARKYYNAVVKEYNTSIVIFPAAIVAKMFGHKEMEMFRIDDSERQNVKIEF